MSAAVYTVELDGKIIARRESLLWVRLDAPGLYVVCTEAEGEGVIVDGEIYHVRGCPILPGKQTVNRMIRRQFPKGTDFDKVTAAEVKRVETWLNDYPREILGFMSSAEAFKIAFDRAA